MSKKKTDRILLLGIDTSSEGDLALAQLHADGSLELLASQQFSGRHQAAEFIPKLSLLLGAANATMQDIRAIIVVSGPGSFTGLRIGLSAAKGLAEAANISLIAISSLAVLAGSSIKGTMSVSSAGRAEYYVRITSNDGEPVESLETEAALQLLTVNKAVVVVDDLITDAPLHEKFAAARSVKPGKTGAYQALLAALPRYLAADFDDIAALDANYVRRPYTDMAAEVKPAS